VGVDPVRTVLVWVIVVLAFAALILGVLGDGATALALVALGVGLGNTAVLLTPDDPDEEF